MAPPPEKKKKKHDPQVVGEAVKAVHSKRMGIRTAARHYGIAASTLADKVKGRSSVVSKYHGLLKIHEEEKLVEWILQMAEVQTTDDIRKKAKELLELRGGTTKDPDNLPSQGWAYSFIKRYPQLSSRTPQSLGKERAVVTPMAVSNLCSPSPFVPAHTSVAHTSVAHTSVAHTSVAHTSVAHTSVAHTSVPDAPVPSSSTVPSKDCDASETFNSKQLQAMKDFGLFITDTLGRNAFLNCITNFNGEGSTADLNITDSSMTEFRRLSSELKSSFEFQHSLSSSLSSISLEDHPRVPTFHNKGKRLKKKTTSTVHYVLSGGEHREAIELQEKAKMQEERDKLAMKTAREEKTRQMKEELESKRVKRELAKVKRQKKSEELKLRKIERQQLAREEKGEQDRITKRKLGLERQIEQPIREADGEEFKILMELL